MDPTLIVALVSAAIALGSLAAAVHAARSSGRSAHASEHSAKVAEEALGIEKERREDERATAARDLVASRRAVLNAAMVDSNAIAIVNTGRCRARQVMIHLEADEALGAPPRMIFKEAREISPGLSEIWKVSVHMGVAPSFTVHMTWADDEGDHEDRQTVHI
jgi:hypothetical protein